MNQSPFIDKHSLRDAFLGNLLERLVELIVHQGNAMLAATGVSFPSRAVSTILLIAERTMISAADIAKELGQPHQLVTQRIELLLKLGIIQRKEDPNDRRRKVLLLSKKGHAEFKLLQQSLSEANNALAELQQDIGTDLTSAAHAAISALKQRPILDRISAPNSPTT